MLKRIRSILHNLPRPAVTGEARLLLRWGLLSAGVLILLSALQWVGIIGWVHAQQLALLTADPFQLSEMDAEVSLLSTGGAYTLSIALTLYLGAVLLRLPSLLRRTHICLLAAAAVILPGFICVLWHGVIFIGAPLVSILLLWLALVPLPLIRNLFS